MTSKQLALPTACFLTLQTWKIGLYKKSTRHSIFLFIIIVGVFFYFFLLHYYVEVGTTSTIALRAFNVILAVVRQTSTPS
jgi:hypothetical protein